MRLTQLGTATGTTTGLWCKRSGGKATFQASVTGTGEVGAVVAIEVSNDGQVPVDTALGTITLTGSNSAGSGFRSDAPWAWVRFRVTSYTSGTVRVVMCEE